MFALTSSSAASIWRMVFILRSASNTAFVHGLVFQDRDGFFADAVQQARLAPDAAHVEVERERDLFLGHAALDRLADHLVFLDRREAADLSIVGEGLVVGGDETFHLALARVLQRLDPQVAVEQQPGRGLVGVPDDDGRLDDPDLGDGGHDLPVLPAGFRGLAKSAQRQDRVDGEGDAVVLEPERDALRGVASVAFHVGAPSVMDRARSAGIVSSPSALSRVMKWPSAQSLRKASRTNISRLWVSSAFLIRSFWRVASC